MNLYPRRSVIAALALTALAACTARVPEQAISWTPQSPAERQLTARWFATANEDRVIRAAEDVLRSAGYRMLDDGDADLGLLVGARETDATAWENARVFGKLAAIFILSFGGATGNPEVQKSQELRAAVLVRGERRQRTHVQAVFQRVVWSSHRAGEATILMEPEVYRAFFSELSSRLTLEAHPHRVLRR